MVAFCQHALLKKDDDDHRFVTNLFNEWWGLSDILWGLSPRSPCLALPLTTAHIYAVVHKM